MKQCQGLYFPSCVNHTDNVSIISSFTFFIEKQNRKSAGIHKNSTIPSANRISITFIKYSIPKQQNIHLVHVPMEHTPERDQIPGHKRNLNKFKRTEIIQRVSSDYKRINLAIKKRKLTKKSPNIQETNEHTSK